MSSYAYYKYSKKAGATQKPTYNACDQYCQTDSETDLIYWDKHNNQCECLIQVNKESDADQIYGEVQSKIKVNPVAFWVTFSIFIVLILILVFFFIQVFFFKAKKK